MKRDMICNEIKQNKCGFHYVSTLTPVTGGGYEEDKIILSGEPLEIGRTYCVIVERKDERK